MDCGQNTFESGEYFSIKDALWRHINPVIIGILCLDCVEARLGRLLRRSDFSAAPINAKYAESCAALAERLGRTKTIPVTLRRRQRAAGQKKQSPLGRTSEALLAYRGKNGRVSPAAMKRFLTERLAAGGSARAPHPARQRAPRR
jgi:hypothetical protein